MNDQEELVLDEPIELRTDCGPFQARYFRYGIEVGVALYRQLDAPGPVIVRIHSSCVFGESFGAADCDCGSQLKAALRLVGEEGGLVAYFYQEGRGAGLQTKMRAIGLQQEENLDTAAAYVRLGLIPDPRDFNSAAAVLGRILGNDREIVLLTNNPKKLHSLRQRQLNVVGSRPLVIIPTDEVRLYLREKVRVLDHQIDLD